MTTINYTFQSYPDSDFMPTLLLEEINRYFLEENELNLDDSVEVEEEKKELLDQNN